MFLISTAFNYLNQRRKRLLITAASVGGVYLLGKWVKGKLLDISEKAALESTARENIRRRFEQNQQDCLFSVMALLPSVGEQLFPALDVEAITAKLKQTRRVSSPEFHTGEDDNGAGVGSGADAGLQDRQRKLELWEELKIASFTRTITSVYLLSLLTLFTHIQLNLLGRFYYIDSVISFPPAVDASEGPDEREPSLHVDAQTTNGSRGISHATERRYLTFSWWLINRGWKKCEETVKRAVEERVGRMSLKQICHSQDVEDILNDVRAMVEFDRHGGDEKPAFNVRDILIPDDVSEELLVLQEGSGDENILTIDEELSQLLDETRDFLDSPDFTVVCTSVFNTSFSVLFDNLHRTFVVAAPQNQESGQSDSNPVTQEEADSHSAPRITEIADGQEIDLKTDHYEVLEKSIPLAALLPIISRQAHMVINGVPNDYLERLSHLPELKAFSAIIYSSFDDQC